MWAWIALGWTAVCTVAVVWLVAGWVWMGRNLVRLSHELPASTMTPEQLHGGRPWWHPYRPIHVAAWFGQRTSAGAFCALCLPFFPGWSKVVPVTGLLVTSSWTAALAAWAAWVVLDPTLSTWIAPPAGALIALVLWKRPEWMNLTPRGGSLDPVWQRLRVYRLVTPTLWRSEWFPWGYGPRSMEQGVNRISVVHDTILTSPLHADILHFLFEYGVCGLACLVWVGWLVVPHLRWGDPWSACWVAGIVCTLGGSPFRSVNLGIVWLTVTVKLAGGL